MSPTSLPFCRPINEAPSAEIVKSGGRGGGHSMCRMLRSSTKNKPFPDILSVVGFYVKPRYVALNEDLLQRQACVDEEVKKANDVQTGDQYSPINMASDLEDHVNRLKALAESCKKVRRPLRCCEASSLALRLTSTSHGATGWRVYTYMEQCAC